MNASNIIFNVAENFHVYLNDFTRMYYSESSSFKNFAFVTHLLHYFRKGKSIQLISKFFVHIYTRLVSKIVHKIVNKSAIKIIFFASIQVRFKLQHHMYRNSFLKLEICIFKVLNGGIQWVRYVWAYIMAKSGAHMLHCNSTSSYPFKV